MIGRVSIAKEARERIQWGVVLDLRLHQLDGLRRARIEPYVPGLAQGLRESFPEELAAVDDDALRAQVMEGALRAMGHGLRTPRDIGRFLNLQVVLGWSFDEDDPRAARALRDPADPEPSRRLDRLVKAAIARLRIEERNAQLRREFDR